MKKKHLVELIDIITTALDAHKMAEWDNKSARDLIAGLMVKRFASYMKAEESLSESDGVK